MSDMSASTEASLAPEAARQLSERWWVFLVVGILTAGAGLLVIFRPWTGVFALAILIAAGFLISGIGDLVGASSFDKKAIPVVWGLLAIAAGILTLVWPDITLWALAVIIGIALILRGLARLAAAITEKPYLWALWAFFGAVEVLVGVMAIGWPDVTIVVLAVLIGIDLLIAGLVEVWLSLQFRKAA
jgi:uncharacterized membrane protein HdeD (DUF308 family)